MAKQVPVNGSKKPALVDDEDFARVKKYTWFAVELRYPGDIHAAAIIDGKTELMENFILGIPTPQPLEALRMQ